MRLDRNVVLGAAAEMLAFTTVEVYDYFPESRAESKMRVSRCVVFPRLRFRSKSCVQLSKDPRHERQS
jgi:hypothetical protein